MYYSRRENHFSKVNNIASVCGFVCRWVVGCELWVACCPDSGRVDPCHSVRFQGEGPPKWVHSHVSRACYMLDMYVRRLQQHQPEQVKPFPRSAQALLTHATSKPMPHHNHVDVPWWVWVTKQEEATNLQSLAIFPQDCRRLELLLLLALHLPGVPGQSMKEAVSGMGLR